MSEQLSNPSPLEEATRDFIDTEFLPHIDSREAEARILRVQENTLITPEFVRNSYHYYLELATNAYQDSGKALKRDATNLAVLKAMDEKLPESQREITVFDELAIFRTSLISELSSKLHKIKAAREELYEDFKRKLDLDNERTAADDGFKDISFLEALLHEELQTLDRVIRMGVHLSRASDARKFS